MLRHSDPRYFLLGSVPTEDDLNITGVKLPTYKQVFMCFLASQASDMTLRAAAKVTVEKVLPFYEKARVPYLHPKKMEEVLKFHTEMKNILKIDHQHRDTAKNKEKIEDFKEKLSKTMKFWPGKALEKMTNEEDRKFLESMMTDRVATMGSVDAVLSLTEKKIQKRSIEMEIREEKERKRVCEEEAQKVEAAKHFENDLVEESSSDETVEMPPPPTRTHKRNIKTGTDLKN